MNIVTPEQLQGMLVKPSGKKIAPLWIAALNQSMEKFAITTMARQAAFLAQILHESNEFQSLQENLNYSPLRLQQVWPSRFKSEQLALSYGNQPEKLANFVYAGRLGNGSQESGDGWKYRGRGLIQLTGRTNYSNCANALEIDVLNDPDLLLKPDAACLSAAWFWQVHGLNVLADSNPGANANDNFTLITKRINGGLNGLQERLAYWNRAKTALACAD